MPPPVRSDHPGVGTVCAPVFPTCLAACAGVAGGCAPHARDPPGARRLAGDGVGWGTPGHHRSSRREPGDVVGPPLESDAPRAAHHMRCPTRRDDRPGGRCPGGTALGTAEPGEGLLPGGGPVLARACPPLHWAAMGLDAALGAGALAPVGGGTALVDRPLLAEEGARPTPASDPWGLGATDAEASPP
jgi:hypothetical protein